MEKFLLLDTTVKKLIRKTLKENSDGYLFFENGDEWKKLFFKNGRLTGASSSSKADYLGQYLISYGIIDTDEFEKAYQSGADPKKSMDEVLKVATPEVLKQLIYEKILDTIFITSRWPDCVYSVVSEKSKDQKVDVEISAEEISNGLKERVVEFREILSLIPTLGARPKIEQSEIKNNKITNQHEIILNYISAGKTITEILSIMTPHNYLLFKCFYQLCKMGILAKGTGAPLSREKVIQLVNESHKCKKCSMMISDLTLKVELTTDFAESTENDYRSEISIYQKLHTEDPENSLYSHCFLKAKSCFIVDFYNSKLSPFAEIGITDNLEKIKNATEIDNQIYELLKKYDGRASIKNIIKLISNRHEIDLLTSIDKLLTNGVIKEIEPQTFIDAIKLGRSEHFDKLFKKDEVNKLFNADISANLTPLMLSVLAGKTCEDIEEISSAKPFYSASDPVFHDYEMTFLMLASMLGNYEAVEFLLRHHAKPDLHNGNSVTALMLALQNGHDDTALLLMQKGADVNARNRNNYSALMIAASKGMAHIVDFMIKLKVDVNQLNSKGQSALISALRFNHKDVVISLIAAGIDTTHEDVEEHSPLYYAESEEMAELIKKGGKNSKQIKKQINKRQQNILDKDKDLLKERKRLVPSPVPLFFFSTLIIATSIINVHLLFFSGSRYDLSSEAKTVMDEIGLEYCNKFKFCRKDIPEHIVSRCHQMGISIVSAYFSNSKSCNMSLTEECKMCIKSLSCEDFYDIDGSNLSDYCSQCTIICK